MKCVICHSDNIKKSDVNEEIFNKNDIIIIPLNILMCGNCGERYYDRKTVRFIEDIRLKINQDKIKLKETGKVMTIAS